MVDRPVTTSRGKKKPGRKRRVAGWVLLVIGVLITGVWGASRWWLFGYGKGLLWITVNQGSCSFSTATDPHYAPTGFFRARLYPDKTYWQWYIGEHQPPPESDTRVIATLWIASYTEWRYAMSDSHHINIILWPFALASLLGGGWLVWSGRRARGRAMKGLCRKCGYDLRGLAEGSLCPECGGGATMQTK